MAQKDEGPRACDAGPDGDPDNKPQNKSPKALPQGLSWKKAAIETLGLLRARFPLCFAAPKERVRAPLKINIHHDVLAAMPELLHVDVGRALKFYVSRFGYLESCSTEGRPRIDLNGEPDGVVSAAEAANAQQWLAKRRKRKPQSAPASSPPESPTAPSRLTLAALKEAAAKRKLESDGAGR
jgi:ProP effector